MLSPVEKLNRALRENRPSEYQSALHRQLGLRPIRFERGASEWEWDAVQETVLNPFGYVSGGYLAVFVDELSSSAIGSLLNDDELAVTAELKLSYLRPAAKGLLRGESRVLRKGKRVAFVEASIKGSDGQLVVSASSTWTVVGT